MVIDTQHDEIAATVEVGQEAWSQVVASVNSLEAAWKQSPFPDLKDFLPSCSDRFRRQVLVELIKVDQECCWQHREPRLIEHYLGVFSELAEYPHCVTALLFAECLTRATFDTAPTEGELLSRFPAIAKTIDMNAVVERVAEEQTTRAGSLELLPTIESQVGLVDSELAPTGVTADDVTPSLPADEIESTVRVGCKFGRFQIRSILGQGSMGTVFRAFDPNLAREVALKTPQFDGTTEPQAKKQFIEEARAAARIRHPNICPVYEAEQIDGQYYIVMALIEGESFSARLQRRLPPPDEAAAIIAKVAQALNCLHEQGIIHQDIKPQNILIDERDEPQLMDFGLAWNIDSRASGAPDGFIGTPAYMPPEQLEGRTIDRRSDVYSLGVVFYQALTGELPFSGNLSRVVTGILHHDPPDPHVLRAGLDVTLVAICLKAMAKAPEDRYQTAGDFAAALAHRERPLVIASAQMTRKRKKLFEWIAVGFGCMAGVLVAIWLAGRTFQGSIGEVEPRLNSASVDLRSGDSIVHPPGTDASTAIQLDLGKLGRASATGEVENSGDTQWFTVKTVRSGLLLIEALTPTDEFDGKMTVFDADLKVVAEDGNSGPANDSQVVLSVEQANTYFVAVSSTHQRQGPFLIVTSQPASAPPAEPFFTNRALIQDSIGDRASEAHAFSLDEGHAALPGSISPASDEDWFSLTPSEDGLLLLKPETPNSSLDTLLELYDDDVLLSRHRDRIVHGVTAGQRYFIRITGAAAPSPGFSATGNYVLRLRILQHDLVPAPLLEKAQIHSFSQ